MHLRPVVLALLATSLLLLPSAGHSDVAAQEGVQLEPVTFKLTLYGHARPNVTIRVVSRTNMVGSPTVFCGPDTGKPCEGGGTTYADTAARPRGDRLEYDYQIDGNPLVDLNPRRVWINGPVVISAYYNFDTGKGWYGKVIRLPSRPPHTGLGGSAQANHEPPVSAAVLVLLGAASVTSLTVRRRRTGVRTGYYSGRRRT